MATLEHKINIDTIIGFLLVKRFSIPIIRMDAYKLGLINAAGKVIREPETEQEEAALTVLTRIILKLKRLLGSKLINFNNFLYLRTLNTDFYNKLVVKGSITQRAEIKRILRDVKHIKEKYDLEDTDVIKLLLEDTNEL